MGDAFSNSMRLEVNRCGWELRFGEPSPTAPKRAIGVQGRRSGRWQSRVSDSSAGGGIFRRGFNFVVI